MSPWRMGWGVWRAVLPDFSGFFWFLPRWARASSESAYGFFPQTFQERSMNPWVQLGFTLGPAALGLTGPVWL